MADDALAESLRLSEQLAAGGAGNQAWSERTDLQVQKMEQTIEQDLAKAMVGLREQFRQHPKFGSHLSPGSPSSAGMSGDPSGLEVAISSGALQPDAAALTDFRSEAAAARDEMLDGLARLRRELEVQRMQQSSTAAGPSTANEGNRQQFQVAAIEAQVVDLRRNLSAQQGAVAELRRDVASQSEYVERCTSMLDQEVQRLIGEVELVRGQRAPEQAEDSRGGDAALLRQDLQLMGDRLDRLEQLYRLSAEERATVSRSLGVVLEMDARLQSVSSALEAERKARAPRSADDAPVAQLRAELAALRQEVGVLGAAVSGERRGLGHELELTTKQLSPEELHRLREAVGGTRESAKEKVLEDLEELQRRLDEAQRSSLASFQEMAEGLMLECTSRQSQVSELRQSLADDISASMEAAREALRADVAVHCKELRVELGAHLEVLERELRCLRAQSGEGGQPSGEGAADDISARVAAIEAEVSRRLSSGGQRAGEPGEDSQGPHQGIGHLGAGPPDEARSLGDAEQALASQRPLISRGLKESLEQLVDKVHRTLKPETETGAAGPAGPAVAVAVACGGGACGAVPSAAVPAVPMDASQGPSSAAGRVRAGSPRRQVTLPAALPGSFRTGSVSFPVTAPPLVPYVHSVIMPSAAQVFVGSTAPAASPAASAPPVFVQHHGNPLTVHSHPPPVVAMSEAPVSVSSLQGSTVGSFVPAETDTRSPGRPVSEAPDAKEGFRRCLQELREENRALRETTGGLEGSGSVSFSAVAPSGSVSFPVVAQSGSVSFPVVAQARTLQASPHVVLGAATGTFGGSRSVIVPGVRMTPGPLFRTVAPAGHQPRAVSPTPAVRRSPSPQR